MNFLYLSPNFSFAKGCCVQEQAHKLPLIGPDGLSVAHIGPVSLQSSGHVATVAGEEELALQTHLVINGSQNGGIALQGVQLSGSG